MTPICRTILIAALGIFVVSAAVLLVSSAKRGFVFGPDCRRRDGYQCQ